MAILPLECEDVSVDFSKILPEIANNTVLIVVCDNEGKSNVLKLKDDVIQEGEKLVCMPRGGCTCCLYQINNQYVWRCREDRNRPC